MKQQCYTMPGLTQTRSHFKIDIRTGKLFPFPFRVLGIAFVGVGIVTLPTFLLLGSFLIPVGFLMATAYQGIEIDRLSGTFREYYAGFMFRHGNRYPCPVVIQLTVLCTRPVVLTPLARTWIVSRSTTTRFRVYLQFSDGTSLHLFSARRREAVMKRVEAIKRQLNIPVAEPGRAPFPFPTC